MRESNHYKIEENGKKTSGKFYEGYKEVLQLN